MISTVKAGLGQSVSRLGEDAAVGRQGGYLAIGLIAAWLAVVVGLPAVLPIQAASWLTFVALLTTPGYLLGDIVAWRLNLDWIERLALAMPLGVAVLALPGMAALLLHWTVDGLLAGWVLAVGLVVAAWWAHRRRIRTMSGSPLSRWARDEIALLALLAAAFVLAYPALSIYKIDGDAYVSSSFVREALTGEPMNVSEPLFGTDLPPGVRYAFNQFLSVSILWSRLSFIDRIDLIATASRSMIALWAILASYMLGKAAGRGSRRFGLLTASIQMLIYMSAPFLRSDNVSYFFFERIHTDKFTVPITMLPVIFALAFRYVREGRRDAWVAAAIATFAVSTVHALIALMLALALAAFGGLHFLLNLRRREAHPRVVGLAILVGIVMFLPFVQLLMARGEYSLAATFPDSLEGWPVGERTTEVFPFVMANNLGLYGSRPNLMRVTADQAETPSNPFLMWRFASNMNRRRIVLFDLDHYITHPSVMLEPPYLLSLLLLPLLAWKLRSNVAAQFAVATSLALLFVMYNPIVTPLVGSFVVPWLLWRMVWLLPYALIIAMATRRLLTASVRILTRLPMLSRTRTALETISPLAFVLVASLVLSPRMAAYIQEVKASAAGPQFFPVPRQIMAQLEQETARIGSVMVLADRPLSVTIPAFVAHANVLGHRSTTISEVFPADRQVEALQRLVDQYSFFHTPLLTDTSVDILRRYDTRYVIVSSGSDLDLQLRLSPEWFEWIIDDQSFSLYAVRQIPPLTPSIQGNIVMMQSDWESAHRLYQEALQHNPADLLALAGMAEAYHVQGQFDLAADTLRRALTQADLPVLHYRLGRIYAEMGEVERSISEFDRAQRTAPQVSRYHLALGDACLRAVRYACAERQFQAGVDAEEQPDEAERLIALGDLWQKRGYPDTARPLYERAVALRPSERNRLRLVSIYRRTGHFEQAEVVLRALRDSNPLSVEIVSEMAKLEVAQANTDQAADLYHYAIWLQDLQAEDSTNTRLALTQAFLEAGRVDDARSELDRLLSLQPDNPMAYRLLGNLYRDMHQPDRAVEAYQHALQLEPTLFEAYLGLSEIWRQQAVPPNEVMTLLQTATQMNPARVTLYLDLGQQLERAGDDQAAIVTYQSALGLLEPDSLANRRSHEFIRSSRAIIFSRLGALYEDLGWLSSAMSYYQAAVSAVPNEAWSWVQLGDAQRRHDDVAAAEDSYRHGLDVDPDHVDAYLRLADIAKGRGEASAAQTLYDQALQIALTQPKQRQLSRVWLDLGAFYEQTAWDELAVDSSDEVLAVADINVLDDVSDSALSAYVHALEADENLLTMRALTRYLAQIGRSGEAIELYRGRIAQGEADGLSAPILSRYYKGLGDLYMDQKEVGQARPAYEKAIALDGWWTGPHLGLAQALSEMGEASAALAELEAAAQAAPGSVVAQLALASALDARGNADRAYTIYQDVARAHPGNTFANLALARAHQARGQWQEAERSYRNAMATAPNDSTAYVGLAHLFSLQARYDEAEALLRQAIKTAGSTVIPYIRLGELLTRRASYEEAESAFSRALQIEPDNWEIYIDLAEISRLQGQTDRAVDNLRKAAVLDDSVVDPLLALASLYVKADQPDRAEEALLQALNRSPGDFSVRHALAQLYVSQGRGADALIQLRQAVHDNPASMEAHVAYADELRRQGRHDEAEAAYEQAEQAAHRSSDGYRALALARSAQGRDEAALALIAQAIDYAPGDPANWIAKGKLLVQQGDLEAGLTSLRTATQLGPDRGQVWQAYANMLLANDRVEEAAVALEKAVTVEPTYLSAYKTLIRAYRILGRDDQANEVAARATASIPGADLADVAPVAGPTQPIRRLSDLWFSVRIQPTTPAAIVDWFNDTARPGDVARVKHWNLDVLDQMTAGRKMVLFPSASDAESLIADWAAKADVVAYDLEHWSQTPAAEQADPVAAVQRLSELARLQGVELALTPDRGFALDYGVEMAPYADTFVLQLQRLQDRPAQMLDFALPLIRDLRQANPDLNIGVQLRAQGNVEQFLTLVESLKSDIDGIFILYSPQTEETTPEFIAALRPWLLDASTVSTSGEPAEVR